MCQVKASVYYYCAVLLKGVTVPNTFMNKKVNAIRFVIKHVPLYANIALLHRLLIILFGLILFFVKNFEICFGIIGECVQVIDLGVRVYP